MSDLKALEEAMNHPGFRDLGWSEYGVSSILLHRLPDETTSAVKELLARADIEQMQAQIIDASVAKERELLLVIQEASHALRLILNEAPKAPYFENVLAAVGGVTLFLENRARDG